MDLDKGDDFTKERIHELSIRAVNQLIADVEAKRFLQNTELAEAIAVCLRHSRLFHLQTLKALLDQRELEGIPSADSKKPRWEN